MYEVSKESEEYKSRWIDCNEGQKRKLHIEDVNINKRKEEKYWRENIGSKRTKILVEKSNNHQFENWQRKTYIP
ncbi:2018_t:CDS:1, partial [Gigaspora rosea]